MPAYRYKATGRDGRHKQGIIQADSQDDAELRVRGRGFTPIAVTEARLERPAPPPPPPPRRRRHLATFLVLVLLAAVAAFVVLDPWDLVPEWPVP